MMNKIFILFFSFSCIKKTNKESLIYDGDKGFKYWLIDNDRTSDSGSHFFTYFDKNGKWLGFYINAKGEFVENKSPEDVISVNTWSLSNDSTIILGWYPNIIVKISKDTMITYNDRLKETTVYITSPDSLIPKEYQRIQ